MSIMIKYTDGRSRTIPNAVRVDTQNFHEGMFDFYDANGWLVEQISMDEQFTWEILDERENKTAD